MLRYIFSIFTWVLLLLLAGTTMAAEPMPVGGYVGVNGKQYHFFNNKTYNRFKVSDGSGAILESEKTPIIKYFAGFPTEKKISGVMSDPTNNAIHYFFFDDGTYATYQDGEGIDKVLYTGSIKDKWSFIKGRGVAAILNSPKRKGETYFFFKDGTYSNYDFVKDAELYNAKVTAKWVGWPKNGTIVGAINHPFDKKSAYIFFGNGTYGRYKFGIGNENELFLYFRGYESFKEDLMSSVLDSIRWIYNSTNIADGESKNLITASSITVPTNYINSGNANGIVLTLNGKYFSDQSIFSVSSSNESLLRLEPLYRNRFEVMGKPGLAEIIITRKIDNFVMKRLVVLIEEGAKAAISSKQIFNAKIHNVRNFRFNRGSEGHPRYIYANGEMQAPIYIELEVEDKITGDLVEVSDITADGSFIKLYDLHTGPEKNKKSYLGWGSSEGANYDKHWRVSRARSEFDLGGYTLPSQQPMAEAEQDEPASAASAAGNFLNRYTYYVTTTEAVDKIICANVGDVYHSCENGQDEFAKIISITKKSYSLEDFIVTGNYFSSSFNPLKVRFIKLTPRSGFYVRKIKDNGLLKYDGDRLVMQGAKDNLLERWAVAELGPQFYLKTNVWYAVKLGMNNVNLSIPYFEENKGWQAFQTPTLNTDDGGLYLIESSKDGRVDNYKRAPYNGSANPSYNDGTSTQYEKNIEGWDRYGNPFIIYLRSTGGWDLNIYSLP
ncbi:hypothetical protein JD508_17815 [Aeromonas jandaei]|uniref:hypothetical protein n=1 Tax=Aeromonas jandaei TaxID=650 RepID=UPI00191EA38F|nr:hypothetical protein [Aeromonas jandaei]MBL0612089.1 hypothetical protein [Aeromonas jandaei]